MPETWRQTITPILYAMMFSRSADATQAKRAAQDIIDEQTLGRTVAQSFANLRAALASGTALTEAPWDVAVSEEQFRIHVGLVIKELEQRRPWPETPYRLLPATTWFAFESPRPIATVRDFSAGELGNLFSTYPDNLPDDLLSFVFKLNTGETLALIGSQLGGESTLYQRGREDPADTLTHFIALTKFIENDITPLPVKH